MRYDPSVIEPKWQGIWEEKKAFEISNEDALKNGKPKYYVLDMFPYPSGAGLHVGHPEGYTATDVVARYKRMQGFNVLHPMGWDAFGLPAERAAMRDNIHPAIITKRNTDNFRRQIKRLGFSYDWSREISTCDASYYRWTQWIFLKLYDKGLAYLSDVPVNWCPALGTVLANEEVKDGKYVETGDAVEKRIMRQWMLRITAYAERLLNDLDGLDWPEGVIEMQRNWIGKSEGAEIDFPMQAKEEKITIFTTSQETLFGVTFLVVAPEHPMLRKITTAEQKEAVENYVKQALGETEQQRTDETKPKTGVWTGSYVINPVSKKAVPVYVADYVLMNYGTGAVMGVPGHDARDHQFAKKYDIEIAEVISGAPVPVTEAVYMGEGTIINSEFLNGLDRASANQKMNRYLEEQGLGRVKVQYRLRDWLFSRQRYWGEPFPIVIADNGDTVPLAAELLPVELPMVDQYRPTEDGQPPLARAGDEWLTVTLPDGRKTRRETNTMPQWAGSCWYYLRFLDATNTNAPWSTETENYWMPVDLYIGGVEHAVLHLLYSRFWHKVLYDCGLVHTKEPFQKLFNQGMILAQSYQDEQGKYYYPEEVEQRDTKYYVKTSGKSVHAQVEKMSKSRYNVVNPDDVIRDYGADAMRLYELFMGPLEQVKMWQMTGVEGVYRFLKRVWRLVVDEETGAFNPKIVEATDAKLEKALHKTIQKVQHDIESLQFNTAISQMMMFVNDATASQQMPKQLLLTFIKTLSPFAPHICEELWQRLGQTGLLASADWPKYDPALCVDNMVTVVLQINGKRRDEVQVEAGLAKEKLEEIALSSELIKKFMDGNPARKVIVVPDRIVNIVV